MADVLIKRGHHAGREYRNVQFRLVRGLSTGVKGPFLLVDGTDVEGFPQRNFKIHVESFSDFDIVGDASGLAMTPVHTTGRSMELLQAPASDTDETDEEIAVRIEERFQTLSDLAISAAEGTVRGLVVSSAPGVGKSFGVEHALERDSVPDKLSFNPDARDQNPKRVAREEGKAVFNPRFRMVKGYMSAAGLYRQLYEYKDEREVLAFDDCDSVLFDENGLNILKVALDTTQRRIISWHTSRRVDQLPERFEYKGSLIFITNLNFQRLATSASQSKIANHLQAIMDRCLYLDLTIDTLREKLIRIDTVVKQHGMLAKQGLTDEESNEVLAFIHANAPSFTRLSLRTVKHVGDLRRSHATNWRRMAELTQFRGRR